MKKIWRTIQLLSGVHRIHHIWWSYGWKLPLVPVAYFPSGAFERKKGFKKINKSKYHNCTLSGVY